MKTEKGTREGRAASVYVGRFAAAVVLQLALLAWVPLSRHQPLLSGAEVTLMVAPVDPYDPLAGYYVRLNYEVEREASRFFDHDGQVWLVVERSKPAWRFSYLSETKPTLRNHQVAIFGEAKAGTVRIPQISRLYVAEDQRSEVEGALRGAKTPPLVDIWVGSDGTAVLRRLRVGGREYGGG